MKTNRTNSYSAPEIVNFGVSKEDAARMVSEGRNWKARNGGARAKTNPTDSSKKDRN